MTFTRYYNPIAILTVVKQVITFGPLGQGLNFRFNVQRTMDPIPDRLEFAIEGLLPARARAMGEAFKRSDLPLGRDVTLQVGYDAAPVFLFGGVNKRGEPTGLLESFVDQVPRGPSLWTLGTAGDGADAYDTDKLADPKSGYAPLETQLKEVLEILGLIEHPSTTAVIAGRNPSAQSVFAVSGVQTCTDLLDNIARTCRARWWIRDGQLFMARNGLPVPGSPAVIIAPMQPGPRFPGAPLVEPVTVGGGGVINATTFLDPRIAPGGQVSYQGGIFRVESVVHSGETRSAAPWTSRIVGRAL
jgi:hypothetical protein